MTTPLPTINKPADSALHELIIPSSWDQKKTSTQGPDNSSRTAPDRLPSSTTDSSGLNIPAPPSRRDWDSAAKKRFEALIEKVAIGSFTKAERRELDALQSIRALAEAQFTPEEVLAQIRYERKIQEIQEVFKRYAIRH
jgi:hypothetical protein